MKLLLVDDHALFRGGLRLLLGAMQRDLAILEADSCQAAADLLEQHDDIKLCLVDLLLKDCKGDGVRENGMEVIRTIKDMRPEICTVVVSSDENPRRMHEALEAGAMGYVLKSESPETMVQALQQVLGGGIYLPPAFMNQDKPAHNAPKLELTERQQQVMDCLLLGWPNKLIVRKLGISENTLKGHLAAIYRALNVSSRTMAVVEAGRRGWKVGQSEAQA
ncbi:response regulator transcription factor [Massilia sp. W12]|uniref:response regulator transcription factor n=1 Tax=Massilia sp. W12 TaxID=3126507 RepID=UPI0030D19709